MTVDIDNTLPPTQPLPPDVERKAMLSLADLHRRLGGTPAELADDLGALGLVSRRVSETAVRRWSAPPPSLDLPLPPYEGCKPCRKGAHWLTPENTLVRERAGKAPYETCRLCRNEVDQARKRRARAEGRAA